MPDHTRERDLVLAPNEFAFISDQTKGNINVYVGPYKTSLANTDQPVVFNDRSKKFERCNLDQAIQVFPTAPEGWYIVLKNPPRDAKPPKTGTVNGLNELDVGRKVNLPGPISFSLWPGQMARVIQGHRLRSNQYVLVRVYDAAAALANWSQVVIKAGPPPADLAIGTTLVIRGTDVAFYIPPTGVEVVRDAADEYVRDAVTLERLEYCILLDENGNKRFIQGPAVVFPEPTETFVERQERRKFKAIELNENSGLYVKVIAPYSENGQSYKVGDELFITGRETMIYFPRPEHAVIKYGKDEIHYAIAIPKGEGRYCLDRRTGQVRLVRGPIMFLTDPRTEVIVRRIIDPRKVALWFPGNQEAIEYNRRLLEVAAGTGGATEYVTDAAVAGKGTSAASEAPAPALVGDDFQRRTTYTPPRTITLDTKYDGAVTIVVWTGYAVLVSSKSGPRRVIVGPDTSLLEYDETLEPMELSTGTPKTDDKPFKTVYLRVLHNKVSDLVEAETRDLVKVRVKVSYRVNFEGDPNRWFNVENYVKFLTDHTRSLIRNALKRVGVQEFYADPIRFVRDTVLGPHEEGKPRAGRRFEENGMRVYDVEVLAIDIGDSTIAGLLTDAQHAVVKQTLELEAQRRRVDLVRATEALKREVSQQEATTRQEQLALNQVEIEKRRDVTLADLAAAAAASTAKLDARLAEQQGLDTVHSAELARQKAATEAEAQAEQRRIDQKLQQLAAEVEAVVKKAGAVSPDLIAALQAFSDRAMVERVSASMAPLAILGGKSVQDVIAGLLRGTALERVLLPAPSGSGETPPSS